MLPRIRLRSVLGYLAAITFSPLALAAPAGGGQKVSLDVRVGGLRSQKGDVFVCLWRKEDKGFPMCSNTASSKFLKLKSESSALTARFTDLHPGEYAISAFHDENSNGKIDTGFMGRPKEGIAISDTRPMNRERRERPSFERSKVVLNGDSAIPLSLMYF